MNPQPLGRIVYSVVKQITERMLVEGLWQIKCQHAGPFPKVKAIVQRLSFGQRSLESFVYATALSIAYGVVD